MLRNFLDGRGGGDCLMADLPTCAATPSPGPPQPCAPRWPPPRSATTSIGDDPTVNALQAARGGPARQGGGAVRASGTQGNLCALMSHCQRGDEVHRGQMAHTYRWEAGGAAVLGSIQPQPLPQQPDGTLALADIEAAIKPDDPHYARTRLLALENTWGGKVLPQDYLDAACALARRRAWPRTWTARGCSTPRWRRRPPAATPTRRRGASPSPSTACRFCFSKGLGAPAGSARRLASVHRAGAARAQDARRRACARSACWPRRPRTRSSTTCTGWRGPRARAPLAEGLAALPGVRVEPPHTNIVWADLAPERAAGAWSGCAPPACCATATAPAALRDPSGRLVRRDLERAILRAARAPRRSPAMPITNTEALTRIIEHREIFHDEMLTLMRRIMSGEMSPTMIAAIAIGLRVKKETVGEIAAAAQVMREFATPVVVPDRTHLVDIVGTGGDSSHTFNISTAATFVAAAAGARVAKHGNRNVSSTSGAPTCWRRWAPTSR
jgi:threonine aldolase